MRKKHSRENNFYFFDLSVNFYNIIREHISIITYTYLHLMEGVYNSSIIKNKKNENLIQQIQNIYWKRCPRLISLQTYKSLVVFT